MVFIGSVPIVWGQYLLSGIYFLGFLLGCYFRYLPWGEMFLYSTLVVASLLGVLAELVRKGLLKGTAVLVSLLVVMLLLWWLPGVSLTMEGVLMEDIKDVQLMHKESFDSRDIVVYRVTFMGDDLSYIVDEIKRPLGFLYRSQWFSGWFRATPTMGNVGRTFVSLIREVDDGFFIYIEPQTEEIEYFIIGDFDDKVYSLEEA